MHKGQRTGVDGVGRRSACAGRGAAQGVRRDGELRAGSVLRHGGHCALPRRLVRAAAEVIASAGAVHHHVASLKHTEGFLALSTSTQYPVMQDLEVTMTGSQTPIYNAGCSPRYLRSHQPAFLFPSRTLQCAVLCIASQF